MMSQGQQLQPQPQQPQPQQQQPQQQEQEQVIHLLVSRAASERQVSGRLTSQPVARGGLSKGDESCGGMGGTVCAPRDAGETGRASMISGTGSDGSGNNGRGASGGASGTRSGASGLHQSGSTASSRRTASPRVARVHRSRAATALGLLSVPEEEKTNSNSSSLPQAGRHRPGMLSEFGGIHGWMALAAARRKAARRKAARRKAVAGALKEKVISHHPPHPSPPAFRPSRSQHPAHRILDTAHRTPHAAHRTPHTAHRTPHSKSDPSKDLPSCPGSTPHSAMPLLAAH